METDMKNCVVCGERIPQSAQYCEKCGSGQPTVAEDKCKDAETTTLKQPHHQKRAYGRGGFGCHQLSVR
ncbi:hypothetical protein ACLODQ_03785 [Lactiplantibacillus plantarum]|uniref:hypothetical protein n=1 Tax=Lactiplantibacillus plantarum TaxID=1590 RepID=UPI000D996FB0|nr:hypothetical protein P3T69_15105 [Lactiplantibacillus plantarum]SPX68078.1 Uncharacterised protein [Lactiplantibacillus plantarum subsp. plantarum]